MATIGGTFHMQVFSIRWGHYDTYRLTLEQDGWRANHLGIGGLCDKEGMPFLFKILDQDLENYPSGLKYIMHELHDKHGSMSDEALQKKLDEISDWISATEKAKPQIV